MPIRTILFGQLSKHQRIITVKRITLAITITIVTMLSSGQANAAQDYATDTSEGVPQSSTPGTSQNVISDAVNAVGGFFGDLLDGMGGGRCVDNSKGTPPKKPKKPRKSKPGSGNGSGSGTGNNNNGSGSGNTNISGNDGDNTININISINIGGGCS